MADETKISAEGEASGNVVPPVQLSDIQTGRKSLVIQTAAAVTDLQKAVDSQAEALEQIKAKNEAQMSREALYFSWFVFSVYYFSHLICFAYNKPLILPPEMVNFIWTLILAPWGLHSIGKLANVISEKIAEKKLS